MQHPILCWLIPIDTGAHPEHPIVIPPPGGGGGAPPGIWGPPGPWPSPPIQLPPGWGSGNPPGIWGGGGVPMPTPPISNVPGAPGYQPPQGGHPEHPIYYPPGIWGGGNVPMPSPPIAGVPGAPGYQPPQIPGIDIPKPSQPIIITPEGKTWVYAIFRDGSSGWVQVDEPPNEGQVQPPPVDGHQWVPAYVPGIGWCWLSLPIKEQPTPNK